VHEAARSTVSPEDILSWSRDRMASYKAPRSIAFVDRLPRSESNKISWRLLQDAEWKR
jgi:fatty-acyl-CoA synthase